MLLALRVAARRGQLLPAGVCWRRFAGSFTAAAANAQASERYPSVFNVSPERGFLPDKDPLTSLPEMYRSAEELLERMPVYKRDGTHGLLYRGDFGPAVDRGELEQVPTDHLNESTDPHLLTALFRDYSFLASAYLLEPCDLQWRLDHTYGLGRTTVPACIAQTLCRVADLLGNRPFMEYAQSYALYNFRRIDTNGPFVVPNMELIRTIHGGESERGFILVHVAMVALSRGLVASTLEVLPAVKHKDHKALEKHLRLLRDTMRQVHDIFTDMWANSQPHEYQNFRTFIFGVKGQPMFPDGVRYLGVGRDDEVTYYRGESGANDSMVPLMDNLLEVTDKFDENPLTNALREFRTYRPKAQTEFLHWVQNEASLIGVREFALSSPNTAVQYLALLDQVRQFRQTHWNMVKGYILNFSDHPSATGGTPITTWLPNQLKTCIQLLEDGLAQVDKAALSEDNALLFEELSRRCYIQSRNLKRELAAVQRRFPG